MTEPQQIRTLMLPGPALRKTRSDDAAIRSFGLFSDEDTTERETIYKWSGNAVVGIPTTTNGYTKPLFDAIDNLLGPTEDGTYPLAINTTTNRMTYVNHNFMLHEAVKFTGGGRPVIVSTGVIASTRLVFVKPIDKDTVEFYYEWALSTIVDWSADGAAYELNRWTHAYSTKPTTSLVGPLLNAIGCPQDASFRFAADDRFWDMGPDIYGRHYICGGAFGGELACLVKNDSGSTRVAQLIIDLDPDVRANGLANPGKAVTAAEATDIFTCVGHGFKTGDIVQMSAEFGILGSVAFPGGFLSLTDYWVIRIDADTFYLSDTATGTAKDVTPADGAAVIRRRPHGSSRSVVFEADLPDTMVTADTITVTAATWTNSTKTLTKTGAFADYAANAGDVIKVTAGTGLTPGFYQVATKASDDAITLVALATGGGQTVSSFTFTNATWDHLTLRLTDVEFTNYVFTAGNSMTISAGTGFTPGSYTIASKPAATIIELASAAGLNVTTDPTDVGGSVTGKIADVDFVLYRSHYRKGVWRWRMDKDSGQGALANIPENYTLSAELIVFGDAVRGEKTTVVEARSGFLRTRPQTPNYAETNRQNFTDLWRVRYYNQWPTGQMVAGATLTGADSAATGTVVEHDLNAGWINYTPDDPDEGFICGEDLTDGSTTITASFCEWPLPIRVATRINVTGTQDASCEVAAHRYEFWRERVRMN